MDAHNVLVRHNKKYRCVYECLLLVAHHQHLLNEGNILLTQFLKLRIVYDAMLLHEQSNFTSPYLCM